MTKVTATKLARVYRGVRGTLPAQPREARSCAYCGKDMMVSAGQVVYFHAECRTKVRKMRKQGKVSGLR